MIKAIFNFFLSLRTAVWLLLALVTALFYGSFIMPRHEEFQALHTDPLFQWMIVNSPSITWWLWLSIGILALLTANTFLCSAEALIRRTGAKNLLLLLSPQIMHAGFLFILLAHMLSSYGGFKAMTMVQEGSVLQLPGGELAAFEKIAADMDSSGYVMDWSASIRYMSADGKTAASDVIRPNNPSVRNGLGIYVKTVQYRGMPMALIEISRDPGAIWALVGGLLFLFGMIGWLAMKIRREEALQ